jgi:Flp pilus assembly protein TadG
MTKHATNDPSKRLWHRHEDGTAAIEFGLLAPLLVSLLLCGAEIGYFIQQTMMVNSAVEAGIAVAAKRGFDSAAITAAILTNAATPGLEATPAPSLFCGCVANNAVKPTPCDATCAGNVVPGHYVKVGAQLTPQSIMPSAILPLPTLITAQSTTRLN